MKYNRYVVSRIGKCVLNRAECVGLIVQFVAEHASDPEMAAIMAQLLEVGYSYSYDEDRNATIYKFGCNRKYGEYAYSAVFDLGDDDARLDNGNERVRLTIYGDDIDSALHDEDNVAAIRYYDNGEMLDFVDASELCDPYPLGSDPDEGWDMK